MSYSVIKETDEEQDVSPSEQLEFSQDETLTFLHNID